MGDPSQREIRVGRRRLATAIRGWYRWDEATVRIPRGTAGACSEAALQFALTKACMLVGDAAPSFADTWPLAARREAQRRGHGTAQRRLLATSSLQGRRDWNAAVRDVAVVVRQALTIVEVPRAVVTLERFILPHGFDVDELVGGPLAPVRRQVLRVSRPSPGPQPGEVRTPSPRSRPARPRRRAGGR